MNIVVAICMPNFDEVDIFKNKNHLQRQIVLIKNDLKITQQDVEKQREVITAWALLGKTPIQTKNPQGHKNKIIRFFIY